MINKQVQDLVTKYYAALHGASEDILAAFATARVDFIDDDLEWNEPFGTIKGAQQVADGLLAAHTQMARELAFVADEVFPARDDTVCVAGHSEATFHSGVQMNGRFVHIWEFAGDRAVRMTVYNEDGAMQRALGLDEDASMDEVMAAMMAAG